MARRSRLPCKAGAKKEPMDNALKTAINIYPLSLNQIMEAATAPASGIKEYIIDSRKKGFSDSAIIATLRQVKWPEDVIQQAFIDANSVIAPVNEPAQIPASSFSETAIPQQPAQAAQAPQQIPQEQQPIKTAEQAPPAQPKEDELFTQPPAEILGLPKEQPAGEVKPKKKFSLLTLVALLLSPVPFVGLGVAMSVIDYCRKNNRSGIILAVLALIINIAIILGILYVIFQIFSLEPDQLTGFSRYANDMFNFVN
jgi:hypothetical protein